MPTLAYDCTLPYDVSVDEIETLFKQMLHERNSPYLHNVHFALALVGALRSSRRGYIIPDKIKGTPSVCTLFCKEKNCCYSDGVAARLSSDACTGSLTEVVTDGT